MKKISSVLLLAGGDSTRFWPLRHKNITRFLGKTLLEHQLVNLTPWAERIIIVTGADSKAKVDQIIEKTAVNIECAVESIVQEKIDEGQAGAILSAQHLVDGEVLLLNSSDVIDYVVLEDLMNERDKGNDFCIFLSKKMNEYFPGGYLKMQEGRLTGIVEKPDPDKVPSDQIKLFVDYYRDYKQLVKALKDKRKDSDDWYEQTLTHFIESGKGVSSIPYEGLWYAIKYPWNVLNMMQYFLSRITKKNIDKTARISKTAVIEGEVYIGKNVTVGDCSKIVGPCYIDDEATIGDYSLVRGSQIGKNTIVGGYCEITRSYLSDNIMLHRNYIGDSVLDESVMIGAETVTANFRFDEKNVVSEIKDKRIDTKRTKFGAIVGAYSKIGIQCALVPGVKIGSQSLIGPGSLVDSDLEDKKFLYGGETRDNKLQKVK